MTQSMKDNKLNAVEFYRMAFEGNPKGAVERFVGREYIQHTPSVGDGVAGFIHYFERMREEYQIKEINFLRVIAEGDLVALHTRQMWPEEEYVTMDFFRFDEEGKIIEHWDAIQRVPEESMNANTMF